MANGDYPLTSTDDWTRTRVFFLVRRPDEIDELAGSLDPRQGRGALPDHLPGLARVVDLRSAEPLSRGTGPDSDRVARMSRRLHGVAGSMEDRFADLSVIKRLLAESRTWAFVGLADNPGRTVYDQARLLQTRGKRIVPVHPSAVTVLGEQGYATLAQVPGPVDVVGVYRRSEFAGTVIDEAIAAGAGAIWMPLNVIDEAAAQRALDAGLDVVMDRCPGVEWALRR